MILLSNERNATEIQKFLSTYSSTMSGNNGLTEKFNVDITTEMLDIAECDGTSELIFVYNKGKKKGSNNHIEDAANKLILGHNRKIISHTFNKIHSSKELEYVNHIKWDTAEAEPHLDGVHISIFKHNKMFFIRAWHKDSTISEAMEKCVKDIIVNKHYPWFAPFDTNGIGNSCCWTFEYVSPRFKNIVEYKEPKLYLIAMFNKEHAFECNKQFTDEFADRNSFDRPERTTITNISEANSIVDSMTTLDKGLIISDSDKHRIKVVNPLYKIVDNAKNFRNKPSVHDLAKLVLLGYQSHIATECNEYSVVIKLLERAVESLLVEAGIMWNVAAGTESRKEFANMISKRPISSLLFEWYMRKAICRDRDTYAKFIKPKYIVNRAKAKDIQKFMTALSDAEIDREYKIKNITS